MGIKNLTYKEVEELARVLNSNLHPSLRKMYPIPRGGVYAAYALKAIIPSHYEIVDNPNDADFFIDDIIDSGATKDKYWDMYANIPFVALIDNSDFIIKDWVVFPWEGDASGSIEDNIVRLLQYVGEDVTRGGLLETPKRVAKAWKEMTSGYGKDPKEILKVFEDGADGYDQMIVRKNIPFYSRCEHHAESIFGHCTIAYIPDGKIVGLSKMDRLCDMYAKRLQVQERMTNQIADAMFEHLNPLGVGVWISARHLCVESRGVCNVNSETVTQALRGNFLNEPDVRTEFLALARS